jgi:hypothetical protein
VIRFDARLDMMIKTALGHPQSALGSGLPATCLASALVVTIVVTILVTILGERACAGGQSWRVADGPAAHDRQGTDQPAPGAILIAEAIPAPRPHARNEKCATLRGQTGTDFYCASSVRAPQLGNHYGVDNLFSNKTGEAWSRAGVGRPSANGSQSVSTS